MGSNHFCHHEIFSPLFCVDRKEVQKLDFASMIKIRFASYGNCWIFFFFPHNSFLVLAVDLYIKRLYPWITACRWFTPILASAKKSSKIRMQSKLKRILSNIKNKINHLPCASSSSSIVWNIRLWNVQGFFFFFFESLKLWARRYRILTLPIFTFSKTVYEYSGTPTEQKKSPISIREYAHKCMPWWCVYVHINGHIQMVF